MTTPERLRGAGHRLVGALPRDARRSVVDVVARALGRKPPKRARWGNLRRQRAFSDRFGFDRGLPVDRHYIELFLAGHAGDVRGDCAEVRDDGYVRRFGRDVTSTAIVDADPGNTSATVLADLGTPDSLPADAYDCFILTQTLHYLPDMRVGVANAWRSLRPGGVLLLTLPTTQRWHDWGGEVVDRWRISPHALHDLVLEVTGVPPVVEGHGNLTAAIAALLGLAATELRRRDLEPRDPDFPIVTTCRVVKPRS